MMNKIKIGIMGCGWIAENAHMPALKNISNALVTAAFDLDINRAINLCKKFSILKAYEDVDKFLESGLDAVIIATPNYTHVDFTLKALEKGISVLCEKPVAFHTNEIDKIRKLAKKNHAVYVPAYVNRWRQDIQEVYELIEKGTIGSIKTMDAGWIRKHGVPRPGTWFTNRELSGGGVLTDLGSHILDICNLFMGELKPIKYKLLTSSLNEEKVESAGAAGWFLREESAKLGINVEDTAIAVIEYEKVVQLQVNLSWLAPVQNDCTYFRIEGVKGSLELKTLFGFSNERLWEKDTLIVQTDGKRIVKHFNKEENNTKLAFRDMLSYFVSSVQSKNTDFTNIEDAQKAVEVIEQLYIMEEENEQKTKEKLLMEISDLEDST